MAKKRKISVRKHKRKKPSGGKTIVKQHERSLSQKRQKLSAFRAKKQVAIKMVPRYTQAGEGDPYKKPIKKKERFHYKDDEGKSQDFKLIDGIIIGGRS